MSKTVEFYQMLDKVIRSLTMEIGMQKVFFLPEKKFIAGYKHSITFWFLKFLILGRQK